MPHISSKPTNNVFHIFSHCHKKIIMYYVRRYMRKIFLNGKGILHNNIVSYRICYVDNIHMKVQVFFDGMCILSWEKGNNVFHRELLLLTSPCDGVSEQRIRSSYRRCEILRITCPSFHINSYDVRTFLDHLVIFM